MKWIKASDFKYEIRKKYFAKWPSGTGIKSVGFFDNYGVFVWSEQGYIPVAKKELNQLLILDETEDAPLLQESATEILKKHTEPIKIFNNKPDGVSSKGAKELINVILAAMEEYASQFKTPVSVTGGGGEEGRKETCTQHAQELFGVSDMEKVAENIGNLHYATLDILMDCLAVKIFNDAQKDDAGGRVKLSVALENASLYIQKSRAFIQEAWEISKPYMRELYVTPKPSALEEDVKALAEKHFPISNMDGNWLDTPQKYRQEGFIAGYTHKDAAVEDKKVPCHNCQGCGCTVCGGSGFINY